MTLEALGRRLLDAHCCPQNQHYHGKAHGSRPLQNEVCFSVCREVLSHQTRRVAEHLSPGQPGIVAMRAARRHHCAACHCPFSGEVPPHEVHHRKQCELQIHQLKRPSQRGRKLPGKPASSPERASISFRASRFCIAATPITSRSWR